MNKNNLKSLRELYYQLSTDPQNDLQGICRARIMFKCGISQKTFYNWLSNRNRVPMAAQTVITEIMRNYYGPDVVVLFESPGKEVTNA
jgi:hypothetical protein